MGAAEDSARPPVACHASRGLRSPTSVADWRDFVALSGLECVWNIKVNATLIACKYNYVLEPFRRHRLRIYMGAERKHEELHVLSHTKENTCSLVGYSFRSSLCPSPFPTSDAAWRLFLYVPVVRAAVGESRRHLPPPHLELSQRGSSPPV